MLGLFSPKVDHPLADAREVRRLLVELPALDASAALESATAWLESLVATPEFPPGRRLELVLQIDEAVRPQSGKLARDYLAPTQSRARAFRLWQIGHAYWVALAAAYRQTLLLHRDDPANIDIPRPQLALLCARLLHAYGGELKWEQFCYGPLDGGLWQLAGDAYLEAGRGKVASATASLYANAGATTPEAEYLRILILQSSSMDKLLPIEIEIAERLITHLLPSFSLTDQARPDNVYWVDLAKPLPPTRLAVIPAITPTLRFFATGSALAALARLRAGIAARGELPADVNFGGRYSPRVVLPVLDHLNTCWSPVPPMRGHERRQVKSRMSIAHGLAEIRRHLLGLPMEADDGDSWLVENVSQGGIGAQVALTGKEWLKVGVLVGMRPEGGDNWLVGVVRRFSRLSDSTGGVGIETLSKTPHGLVADSRGLSTELIALDPLGEGEYVRLALSPAAWEEQIPLKVEVEGRRFWLFPNALVEDGARHVIGQYRAELAV